MNIRPKTVRRLLLLVTILAVCVGGVTALLLRTQHRQQAEIANLRVRAFEAYNAGDYSNAVSLLGSYLTRSQTEKTDRDALFAYAKSRAETPMEGGRQIYEAIGLMNNYLNVASGDAHNARHELLTLYLKARYYKEARELAAELLKTNPRDLQALQTMAQSLINDHKYEAALPVCDTLNELNPTDLLWQQKEVLLMNDLKRPAGQIVARASQLLASHPDDARFHTLMAVAYGCANDDANAGKSVEAAAKLPPPADAESVLVMARVFDSKSRFDLSDALLAKALATHPDPLLERVSVQRLFERQKTADVADRLQGLDPASPQSPTALLGYRALALFDLHRPAEAEPVVKGLESRKDDASMAWSLALRTHYAAKSPEPAVQIKNYEQAIARDPENPVFRLFLGDARASMGESDSAIREWGIAQRLSPSWPLPMYHMSREFSATGRYPAALQTASILRRIAPNMLGGDVAYAVAWWGLLSKDPQAVGSTNGEHLLKLVEYVLSKAPGETELLPVYAALLSRRGHRDRAIAVVKAAIEANPPPSEAVLGQLSRVSTQEHLDLSPAILGRAEQVYGLTPSTGYSKALSLYESGKTEAARQLALQFRTSHPNDPAWEVAGARFRDIIGDPAAVKNWIEVCEAHPKDLAVQSAALASPSRQKDRAYWRKTIDRVKEIAGPESQVALVEEARWQLAGHPNSGELDSAIASLDRVLQNSPELADVHRLLAEALLQTARPDRITRATAELNTAHELQPEDFQTVARLAALLGQQGQAAKELELVDAVTRGPAFSADRRIWAAGAYADLGHIDAAISLLTADGVGKNDPALQGSLATLYGRSRDAEKAADLYRALVNEDAVPASILADGAEFFARRHDARETSRFVERLNQFQWSPGEKEIFVAKLNEVGGSGDEAIRILSAAAEAQPKSEHLWRELAGTYLRAGRLDDALKADSDGIAANPDSAPLLAMREQIGRLRVVDPGDARALREIISRNPQDPAAGTTLKALADARDRKDPPRVLLSTLRSIADRNPTFMPAQVIAVNHYLAWNQSRDAIDLATRAGAAAPNSPEPARLLYDSQAAAGNWENARAAAIRWRELAGPNSLGPDEAIAQSYLQQPNPDPASALKQLEPYESDGSPESTKAAALPLYCRALIAAGRADQAADRLKPLLAKSPVWTRVWLELAAASKDAESASHWIEQVAPGVGNDSVQQKLALATAWEQVGTRFDSVVAHQASRDVLQPIVSQPPVPQPAWRLWGIVNNSLGNLSEEERGREEFLKQDPANPQAQNDLAYTLLLEGGSEHLARAQSLCTAAIAADPEVSTFYDTLARIRLQSGDTDGAQKNFRTAIDKDAKDVDALIGLADVLQGRPADREEAKAIVLRINALVDSGSPLNPTVRKQWVRVKSALTSAN